MNSSPDLVEAAIIKKIAWRIMPLAIIAYCIAYIDRTNIAVAALTMNKDLGFSATIYGLGAGVFFLGYFIFEIPSNVILERVGARLWIARIMFTWGIFSAACAFVTGPVSFMVIRFLLGVAEAGFFPGMILYFTYWFPDRYRGRIIAGLFLAQPIANALANIVSAIILEMDGFLGFRGWQWVFLIEAAPAVILSVVVLRIMTDRPALATWLEPAEQQWLKAELDGERASVEGRGRLTLSKALLDPRVITLSLIYFASVTANYGTTFFMPQIVKGLGMSNLMTGFASAIPYLVGMIGLVVWGWSSDRSQERRWHLIVASITGCVGLAGAGALGSSFLALAAMSVAVVGIYGSRASFWPLPSLFLSGTAAAGAIAFINAVGNLGGYVGPFVVGWIKDTTNSFEMALYFLAACSLASGAIAFFATRACGVPAVARRSLAA
ncbi:MFS transporter, ACS family, tartrate transporter [Rhizobiales bacterium GAS191]|nr:MFS transporter, ACS family, tartrate transporter [Rhizobiales bacterium GAS188]SEE29553.1 MFS transporter, ACS family, tartrate transporter [Rhizobiales bacterium GAS191]